MGSYVRLQEYTRENMHMQTQLAPAANIFLICKLRGIHHTLCLRAVALNTLCGGSDIADALSGIRKSVLGDKKTASKFEPGDEPETQVSDQGDRLRTA